MKILLQIKIEETGASIFMATTDYLTHNLLSFYYFPNWKAGVMLFLRAPLAAITSIELAVIVSARVTYVRGANQFGSLMFVPFMVVFAVAVDGAFAFSVQTVLSFPGSCSLQMWHYFSLASLLSIEKRF